MARSAARADLARQPMQMMAHLIYIMEQPEPKDYLILATVKYIKAWYDYVKMEMVRQLLSLEEKEFNERVARMRGKGWVAVEGEYINIAGYGDKELDALAGWVSYAIQNIKERKPLAEWSKHMK